MDKSYTISQHLSIRDGCTAIARDTLLFVIARSEATWRSYKMLQVHKIATAACALPRNDPVILLSLLLDSLLLSGHDPGVFTIIPIRSINYVFAL
ncbi:MAG: hypothetical protein ABSB79_12970 [Syntrophales bacterium]